MNDIVGPFVEYIALHQYCNDQRGDSWCEREGRIGLRVVIARHRGVVVGGVGIYKNGSSGCGSERNGEIGIHGSCVSFGDTSLGHA